MSLTRTTLRPSGPYDLSLVAGGTRDPTRQFRDGVFECVYETANGRAHARVWQLRVGELRVVLQADEPEPALAKLRFVLAVDDDHTAFLRRFARDPLIGPVTRRRQGMRPLRTATVTHALLSGLCGQLVAAREARRITARVIRAFGRPHAGLLLPPQRADFASLSPAQLAHCDLVARKAGALVRISRSFDLERLHDAPTEAVVRRLCRERGVGPWTAGVVCLRGLGRHEHGLVGDLALIKLCSALLGRKATAQDTAELLARYGDWAGYAGAYLMASGLVPSAPSSASDRPAPRSTQLGGEQLSKQPGAAASECAPALLAEEEPARE